ncbi:aminodeoxychorismate lyase [Tersicoccus sp. Bi-70]|uniref:aminodeoxychorismate lyase n=1 Tax=Tersicoccus sp. Bi-70 TaxID=1897634 RepID=UPI000978202D|nr:aminodeoxychorismate lyase [Tersicoccus sp. Bi-70]OMH34362.1 4-amino-4-deoxychorismate lyase [Tersicoccus sp. Bi-70]
MSALVLLNPDDPDGRVADPDAPQLLVTDLGVVRGDGIFETLLAVDGRPLQLDAHLDRLVSSADALDLTLPDGAHWRAAIDTGLAEFARRHGEVDAMIRLVGTRGVAADGPPSCWVYLQPVPPRDREQRDRGLDIVLLDRGYSSEAASVAPWLLLGSKTTSYAVNMAALRHAHRQGADDAIFVSSDGRVLEGPTSTVLIARTRDGVRELVTPLLRSGILAGTTQGALFATAEPAGWQLGYGPLTPEDLHGNDGVWLASSVRLLAPIRRVDGREIPVSPELTEELTELLLTATRR